ncbi:MAG: hypothetical protein NT007_12345 [Candidatus Kapabacteria bacterium]|nr:hypothetical protein [Candidatus Kapabacteria bacterium]
MKKFQLIAAILLAGFLTYCSDNGTTNPPVDAPKTYIPINKGSYWTYLHYNLDTLNKRTDSFAQDSLVVIRRDTVGTRIISRMQTSGMTGISDSSAFYTMAKDSLFCNNEYLYPGTTNIMGFPIPLPVAGGFSKLASTNPMDTAWKLIDTTIKGLQIPFNGSTATVDGKYTMRMFKSPSVTVNYGENEAKSALCEDFTTQFIFSGTATVVYLGLTFPVPLVFTIQVHHYMNSEIGMVRVHTPSISIPITVLGQTLTKFNFTGSDIVLLRYKAVK